MGGFTPGNMPDMGSFDPNNMPDMGGFMPGNMPDMGSFDPNNMPDMGSFTPGDMSGFDPNNIPGQGNWPSGGGTDTTEAEDESQASEGSSDKTRPSGRPNSGGNFPNQPGGSSGQSMSSTTLRNLILYGICFAIALAAVLILTFVRKRR